MGRGEGNTRAPTDNRRPLCRHEVASIEEACKELAWKLPGLLGIRATHKVHHCAAHIPAFARANNMVGLVQEQGIEHLHHTWKEVERIVHRKEAP